MPTFSNLDTARKAFLGSGFALFTLFQWQEGAPKWEVPWRPSLTLNLVFGASLMLMYVLTGLHRYTDKIKLDHDFTSLNRLFMAYLGIPHVFLMAGLSGWSPPRTLILAVWCWSVLGFAHLLIWSCRRFKSATKW